MNKLVLPLIIVATFGAEKLVFAKTAVVHNSSANKNNENKKTIGQFLKQADRGSGLSLQKTSMVIPESGQDIFKGNEKNVDLSSVKPPRTSAFYENGDSDQGRLEKITDQQIGELFKLTKQFKNSPRRGELWLRLAELYVEKAGIIDFRRQGAFDIALKEYQSGQRKVKPTLNLSDAKEYNKKAIQLYEWFVRDFPKDEKMDQALFFLGYNYYEINNVEKGTQFYTRLTKEHPHSVYVVEANFALAEYYFESEKWKTSESHYAEVLKYKKHRLFEFSSYKMAWCLFRGGDSAAALKTMEALIRRGKENPDQAEVEGKKNFNRGRLANEGLRDIVLFYAEVGEPEKAPAYFKSLVGDQAFGYLEKLAYYYSDKGNLNGTRYLFNFLIQQAPTSAKAFDYKFQIVKAFSNAKKSREFREEIFSWMKDFSVESAWYQTNKGNDEFIKNSYKLREQTMRSYVLQQHQTAQNSRAPYSQTLALEGYKLYLQEFKDAAMIADMHFYFAELLYDMGKFDLASAQYRWVVDNGQGSKFYAKAAENLVLSSEKALPSEQEISKKVGKTVEPVALDPRIEKFIEAVQEYIARVPKSDRVPEMKFRVGRLYYLHNQFDQAISYFKEIVGKYPKTKYAEYSANLLLDIFNLKKDYAGLEKVGGELLAMPGIAGSKAADDIRAVLEKSNFKKAQDLEGAKDYQGSAQQFESFAKKNPRSNLATTANYNAAINYERSGFIAKALALHLLVLKSGEKEAEPLKHKSRRLIAKLYQDSGQLEEAAAAYKLAAQEMGQDPLVPNMLFNAAILYEAVGKPTEAMKNYEDYQEKVKKPSQKVEAIFPVATILRKQEHFAKAIQKYEEYVGTGLGTPERNVESAYWIYAVHKKQNKHKLTDEWRTKTLSLQRKYAPDKKGVGASYAAKIKLDEARVVFDELRSIRIPATAKLQAQVVQKKISLVSQLNKDLSEVVKYDSSEEIVGALSLLGEVNLHMGDSLMNAPLPSGLNAEQVTQYKAGIAKIAEPFYAKVKDSLRAAVNRGSELDVYDTSYLRARELLLKLDSQSLYDHGEQVSDVKQGEWVGL